MDIPAPNNAARTHVVNGRRPHGVYNNPKGYKKQPNISEVVPVVFTDGQVTIGKDVLVPKPKEKKPSDKKKKSRKVNESLQVTVEADGEGKEEPVPYPNAKKQWQKDLNKCIRERMPRDKIEAHFFRWAVDNNTNKPKSQKRMEKWEEATAWMNEYHYHVGIPPEQRHTCKAGLLERSPSPSPSPPGVTPPLSASQEKMPPPTPRPLKKPSRMRKRTLPKETTTTSAPPTVDVDSPPVKRRKLKKKVTFAPLPGHHWDDVTEAEIDFVNSAPLEFLPNYELAERGAELKAKANGQTQGETQGETQGGGQLETEAKEPLATVPPDDEPSPQPGPLESYSPPPRGVEYDPMEMMTPPLDDDFIPLDESAMDSDDVDAHLEQISKDLSGEGWKKIFEDTFVE